MEESKDCMVYSRLNTAEVFQISGSSDLGIEALKNSKQNAVTQISIEDLKSNLIKVEQKGIGRVVMLDNLKQFMQISEQINEPRQFVSYEFDPEVINERIQKQVEVYTKQLLKEKIARLSTPYKLVGLDPELDFGVQVVNEKEGDKITYKIDPDSAPALKQEFIERVSALIVNAHGMTGLEIIPEQTMSIGQSPEERDSLPYNTEVSNTLGTTDLEGSSSHLQEEFKKNEFKTPRFIIQSKSAKPEPSEADFSEKIQFNTFDKRPDCSETPIDSNPSGRIPVQPDIKIQFRDNYKAKPRRHGLSGAGSSIVSSYTSQETEEGSKFSPRLHNQEVSNIVRKSSLYSDPHKLAYEVNKSTITNEEKNRKFHGSPATGNKFQDLDSSKMPISMQSSNVSTPYRRTKMNENLKSGIYGKIHKKPTIEKPEKPKKLVIVYPNLSITSKKDLSSAYGNIFDSKPKSRTGNRKKSSNLASAKVEVGFRSSSRPYLLSRNND